MQFLVYCHPVVLRSMFLAFVDRVTPGVNRRDVVRGKWFRSQRRITEMEK